MRAPFREVWWGDARVRVSYDTNKGSSASAGSTAKVAPSFRVEYRLDKAMTFEGEATVEVSRSRVQGGDTVWSSLNVGYRYVF